MYLIECPHCSDKIHLKNVEKYAGKSVRFKCKAPDCLKTFRHTVQVQLKTRQGTVLITDQKTQAVKTAWLTYQGTQGMVRQELGKGEFVVGRKASTSKAQVQIAARDLNMSRHHCKVVGIESRGGLLFTLQDLDSINGIFHNGVGLEGEEIIFLTHGDIITLGQTQIQFVSK